jgi:dTMP kinase
VNEGILIAFEGIDGCGKSTQLERLAETLRAAGHDVLETREPTDGTYGRRIRAMLRGGERVPPEEELRWFLEDRAEHVEREIAPALAAGRVVLTDRYLHSTVAYQGARGFDWRDLLAQSEARFPLPDLVVLVELAPREALARIRARGGPLEAEFEEERLLERVAEVFASLPGDYILRIDGAGAPDLVATRLCAAIAERLPGLF